MTQRQVAKVSRPWNWSEQARWAREALLKKFGQSSAKAEAFLLSFAKHEAGDWVHNNNPANMRAFSLPVDFYTNTGPVNEYRNGQLYIPGDKKFQAFPDAVTGYVATLNQLERRWPKAISVMFSDALTLNDFAAALSPLPSGYWWFGKPWENEETSTETINGQRVVVTRDQKRAKNLAARNLNAAGYLRHYPRASEAAGLPGSPLA